MSASTRTGATTESGGPAPVVLGLLVLPIAGAVGFVLLVVLLTAVAPNSAALAWIAVAASLLGPPVATAAVGVRRGTGGLAIAALTVGCALITLILVLAIVSALVAAAFRGGSLTFA